MKKLAKLLCAAALSFALPFGAEAKNNVLSVRTGIQSGNVSRFVLETSESPEYGIFYLEGPRRIVVDVHDANFGGIKKESLANGFIVNVRVGALDKETARFVLDLSASAKVKNNFVLKPIAGNRSHRLVVDVEAAGEGEFSALVKNYAAYASAGFKSARKRPVVEEEEIVSGAKKPGSASSASSARTQQALPSSAKKAGEKANWPKVIVIDPGHGGQDPGAIGKGGTQEKDIVLLMAKQLRDILKKRPEYTVLMTRETDIFIPLRERAEFAEKRNAALFISVHADSSPKKTTKGFSVYTLSERATDEESKKIAEKENAADLLGIGALSGYDDVTRSILGDLLQTQVKIASAELANEMVKQVSQDLMCVDNPHREAPFTVLRSAIPSVLIETGFLSNGDEEKKLKQKWYRDKLAYSLARAIDAILKE